MSDLDFNSLLTGLVEEHEAPDGSRLRAIPLDEVYEDPNNPRKAFDEGELQELAASIKAHGVLQPVTVRPRDERGFMIRYGARRYRAARIAGLEKLDCIVTSADASEADILAAQVVENHHRAGLSTDEWIRAVDRMLELGLSQGEAGAKLSISREAANMYASLRDLPPALAPLTATLGLRALYELNAAWKRDPARTEALVAEKGDTITVAEARALAGDLKPSKASKPAAATAKTPDGEGGVLHIQQGSKPGAAAGQGAEVLHIQQPPSSTGAAPARRPVIVGFDVKVGRRVGRLSLDAGPDSETVLVEFDGGAVEPTPVAAVRLVGVRSH